MRKNGSAHQNQLEVQDIYAFIQFQMLHLSSLNHFGICKWHFKAGPYARIVVQPCYMWFDLFFNSHIVQNVMLLTNNKCALWWPMALSKYILWSDTESTCFLTSFTLQKLQSFAIQSIFLIKYSLLSFLFNNYNCLLEKYMEASTERFWSQNSAGKKMSEEKWPLKSFSPSQTVPSALIKCFQFKKKKSRAELL